ncbi:hypothetical protein ONZ51_g4521 [Trametes cubensis]|uniref:Uncharacterized protein n=1 Tax=Trametes cubensis TaxID=1111947 RepID=A0AAD7TW62_9APHY|nr:hypothetical protein ONZ51_g4521 [Trametes cubensis]
MPGPNDSDPAGLPSYSDVQAAYRARSELRQNFMTLTNDQLDIQELFRSVAAQLESTPEIGQEHPLCAEWNELRQVRIKMNKCGVHVASRCERRWTDFYGRTPLGMVQRHRKVYRDSQQNAGMCAHFLKNFAEILVPLSQSPGISMNQKTQMIGKFLEVTTIWDVLLSVLVTDGIPENAEKFSELAKEVEVFPRKVASALRLKAEPQGFFESVWTGLEELCMSIWNTLNQLLVKIVNMFKLMLSRLEKMRFSCCMSPFQCKFIQYELIFFLQLAYPLTYILQDVHHSLESELNSHEMSSRQVVGTVGEDAKAIAEKLTAFESAWHVVRLACSLLLSDLALARSFVSCDFPISEACDSNLRAAALVHTPLVECLNAYSVGKSPDFL